MYSEAENGWMLSFSTLHIPSPSLFIASWIVKRQRLPRASLSTYHHASCDHVTLLALDSKNSYFAIYKAEKISGEIYD